MQINSEWSGSMIGQGTLLIVLYAKKEANPANSLGYIVYRLPSVSTVSAAAGE